jgi:hypothetical protein
LNPLGLFLCTSTLCVRSILSACLPSWNPVAERACFPQANRVLRRGGHFVVSFSDRMFEPKAVALWRDGDDNAHVWTVAAYFHFSQRSAGEGGTEGVAWKELTVLDLSREHGDPLFVVQATKN